MDELISKAKVLELFHQLEISPNELADAYAVMGSL